jgi:hypothetical protein
MMSALDPFDPTIRPAVSSDEVLEAKIRRKVMARVINQIGRYATEARVRGWSGPEQIYRLTIVRLKEDLEDM